MYINKAMALLQSQMIQLQATISGFQTTCSTGSEKSSKTIETTIFYENEEDGDMIESLIRHLWHDGDTIERGEAKRIHWIEYQVSFR